MRPRPAPSLQGRLVWRLAAVFLIGALVAIGGLVWQAVTSIDSLRDRSLQAQLADLLRHVERGPDGRITLTLPSALQANYEHWGNAFLFAIYDAAGRLVARSTPAAPALFLGRLPAGPGPQFFRIEDIAYGPYYGYLASSDGLRIAVAQGNLHDDVLIDSLVDEFLEDSAWWLVLVVVLALLVGALTIRRSLAPLQALSSLAARIGPRRTELRLPDADLPREVRPLVDAVNRALDRLEEGFELQRRFVADAAHELRTPLAVLTARLDGQADGRDGELRQDVARLNRVVEQLLRVARLDAAPLERIEPVDLHALATEAVSALAPRAIRQQRAVELHAPPGPVLVLADHGALLTAITNLVENALSHTPTGSRVEIAVGADGSLAVADQGPGVPAADREAIFRRFWRGRGATSPGAGLGLAIVAETMRALGGRVEVGDAEGGGARFSLHLTPATAPRAAGPRGRAAA
jgi:signal transduction histidine kinase